MRGTRMSYNKPGVTVAGISLWDINPNDIALKNTFADDLISLMTDIGAVLGQLVYPLKVVKGMGSLAKLRSITPNPTYLERRYCSANALKITWDNFDRESTKTVLRDVLSNFENKVSILVHDNSIEVYRTDRRGIEEIVDGETRTFFVLE